MKYQLLMSIAIVTSIGSVSLTMPSIAGSRFRPFEGRSTSRLLLSKQPNLVDFPEVGLAIPQPSGFTKATSFYGFEQAATSSSVVLSKIPGPFSAVTKGFNKETLATRGISLISKQPIKIDNQSGFLLQVSQSAAGQKFLKWILVFGNEESTTVGVASFLEENATKIGEPLKQVLLAASPRTSSAPTASSLPFKITPVAGLSLVTKVSGVGKVALFTKDGNIPTVAPTDPLFVVAPSLGDVAILDQKSFATRRISAYPQTDIVAIRSTTEISIDNLTGWEIVANGRDKQTKAPLAIYQVMLFPKQGGYIVITGIVGDKQSQIYMPKFKAMALTYRNSK
ncbi:hypothetical protein [Chamaesiphon sp. OTE_20_metabat_361]|uniref:hypothetical protein n=1 Tax=Chamaesiphon sp. OTE_20_metabat_361 TaxID=2964689 RepID=UPI00286CC569|nr:hypothetical protein [Chamaesiphon sp. OTE_20_metabat_361]